MNDTGNRIIAAIVVVLIAIGAWYLGATLKPASETTAATSTPVSSAGTSSDAQASAAAVKAAGTFTASGGAISVKDQPAGSYVTVASVTLEQTGWVAVRDANGRTLGAGRFDAGTYSAAQVPLLRNTEAGQRYQALLYIDDGDKIFDLHKDTLVMNGNGSIAGTTFTALNGD